MKQIVVIYGKLEPGASIGMHRHEEGSEVIYILQGKGKAIYDDKREILEKGVCHDCPQGHSHCLIHDSNEDLVFFAVVPRQ